MDEFWVCQQCRSLNRTGTGRCYHCKQKFGSKPKAAAVIVRNAGAPGPNSGPLPPYLVRPAALGFATPADGTIGGATGTRHRFRRPHLADPIRKRIAWAIVTRRSVSVSWLGYVTAAMLSLLLLEGLLLVASALPTALNALQSGSPQATWEQLDAGQQGTLQVLAITLAAIALITLFFFSLFIGLTTHNAPGLGAQTPLLTPYRAGVCWLRGLWTQARLAFGLVVPATLVWLGYTIPGLVLGIVVLEIAQRRLDDPFGWLSRPSRHLADLYLKLGIDGAPSALVVTIWSACFWAMNVLAITTFAVPIMGLVSVVASVPTHRPEILGWQASGYGPAQMGIALLVVSLLVSAAGAIGLLIPITVNLVQRQRTRRTLVRVGRARPWEARPDASAARVQPTSALYDPYDRPDDQASLYSPSTTSSPAWSEEPSAEPPASPSGSAGGGVPAAL